MNTLYRRLEWLPKRPEDFSSRVKALQSLPGSVGAELQALATHALEPQDLRELGGAILDAVAQEMPLEPLVPFRLAVSGNLAVERVAPPLIASAARHGIALQVVPLPHAASPGAGALPMPLTGADAVLVALDLPLPPRHQSTGQDHATAVAAAMQSFREVRASVRERSNAVCIIPTFAAPIGPFCRPGQAGNAAVQSFVDALNCAIVDWVHDSGDVLLDVAGIAETVGLADWHAPAFAAPCTEEWLPLYTDHVARTIAAMRGRSAKVLVLDLDNTVWGGVIGDDGLDGIQIAQGDARGEAYLSVQRLALDLRERGILLAVSSKNTDEIAREPFEKHAEMLLKLHHIAVFQANWQDKATNLRAIAEQLSLGLDSLVFLDDNPVERGLVRKLLPQVKVPELPDDPAYYPRTLTAAGYFDAPVFSAEDRERADYYQGNAKRADLHKQAGGIDAYLTSLSMVMTVQPFDAVGRARVVQLINKSNQYNLTTRRYTEPEIAAAEKDPEVFTLQVRLADAFGDNGMISVVICRPAEPDTWNIDTWLMSCRVLGRNVERAVLMELTRAARRAGITKLAGTYCPTKRNELVQDHYARLGFTQVGTEANGTSHWELFVNDAQCFDVPIRAVRNGLQ